MQDLCDPLDVEVGEGGEGSTAGVTEVFKGVALRSNSARELLPPILGVMH